ncbi:MAG: response regulator [Acidobacteriota bacterium]
MPTILIVDDDENLLKLYAANLHDDGYEVITTRDAREALKSFERDRPDLVVLDIRLPGMDGLETIGHLLSIDRAVPVIFHTSYAHFRENFLSWSADAYVDKTSDMGELKRTIRKLLASRAHLRAEKG